MKTYMAKPDSINRIWYVVDADGKRLGVLTGTGTKELLENEATLVIKSVNNIIKDNGTLVWETL